MHPASPDVRRRPVAGGVIQRRRGLPAQTIRTGGIDDQAPGIHLEDAKSGQRPAQPQQHSRVSVRLQLQDGHWLGAVCKVVCKVQGHRHLNHSGKLKASDKKGHVGKSSTAACWTGYIISLR